MLHKFILVDKEEEAGLIVISRLIALMSLMAGLFFLCMYFSTGMSSFYMMGFFIMKVVIIVHMVFALGLIIKIIKRSSLIKCLLSLFYVGMNFALLEFYEMYFLSLVEF